MTPRNLIRMFLTLWIENMAMKEVGLAARRLLDRSVDGWMLVAGSWQLAVAKGLLFEPAWQDSAVERTQ